MSIHFIGIFDVPPVCEKRGDSKKIAAQIAAFEAAGHTKQKWLMVSAVKR
jgi:hypothetical protein